MNRSNLDRLRIATPCPISWDQMSGDSRVRHCDHCQLNVYNISELSRSEAETLFATTEGRLCARLYRRNDGTIITRDCPIGLRAVRLRLSKTAAAVFAIIGTLSSVALGQNQSKRKPKDSCSQETTLPRKDSTSYSQETMLSGTVLDEAGAVVPGAGVFLEDALTKTTETKTGDDGRFQFVSLPAGRYSVAVFVPGFKGLKRKNINIAQKQAMDLIITLKFQSEVLLGVIGFTEDPPGTTTITDKLLRSLPH